MDEQPVTCPSCGQGLNTEKFCPMCGAANPINYIDESLKVERPKDAHRKGNGKKIAVAFVVVAAALAIVVAGFFANSYAFSSLQFRISDASDFDYSSLSSTVSVDACNPTAFPASFDRLEAVMHYRGGDFAALSVDGGSVMPYKSSTFAGAMGLTGNSVSGVMVAFPDVIAGTETAYNEEDISLTMTVDGRIMNIVPYSHSRVFTFSEFKAMSMQGEGYSC
jgi:hypothetical protein